MLTQQFGREQVFMDVDTIDPGSDFAEQLEGALSECQALIAVIGPRWETVQGEDGNRRLDNPDDFVRLEIARALEKGIRVYPVLVGGAQPPPSRDLPEDLRALSGRHAHELSHIRFKADAKTLIDKLRPVVTPRWWDRGRNRQLAFGAAGLALVAVVAVVAALVADGGGPDVKSLAPDDYESYTPSDPKYDEYEAELPIGNGWEGQERTERSYTGDGGRLRTNVRGPDTAFVLIDFTPGVPPSLGDIEPDQTRSVPQEQFRTMKEYLISPESNTLPECEDTECAVYHIDDGSGGGWGVLAGGPSTDLSFEVAQTVANSIRPQPR